MYSNVVYQHRKCRTCSLGRQWNCCSLYRRMYQANVKISSSVIFKGHLHHIKMNSHSLVWRKCHCYFTCWGFYSPLVSFDFELLSICPTVCWHMTAWSLDFESYSNMAGAMFWFAGMAWFSFSPVYCRKFSSCILYCQSTVHSSIYILSFLTFCSLHFQCIFFFFYIVLIAKITLDQVVSYLKCKLFLFPSFPLYPFVSW